MQHRFSPHFNSRPKPVDLIVLHAISLPEGDFSGKNVEQLFMGTLDVRMEPAFSSLHGVRLSAHFVVDREGKIIQYVACDDRAWHAGVSAWQGVEQCNDYSIGIELIGDQKVPFTSAQYRECARLCFTLMQRYGLIRKERIVGHQDVAPGRKWDPGCQWSWYRFRRALAHIRHPLEGLR